jgi:hypothetical protein
MVFLFVGVHFGDSNNIPEFLDFNNGILVSLALCVIFKYECMPLFSNWQTAIQLLQNENVSGAEDD